MALCYCGRINTRFSITGLGALSALGEDVPALHQGILARRNPFRRLGELLGEDSPHAALPAAWIRGRELLIHRKWSPATMAALHVAREAVRDAGWTAEDLRDAALVVGTSRGNAAGWLGPWPGRRPFKLMAASNTIHSEPASAISIELGITGPNHVTASGCAAGLDAVGVAMMMLKCGLARRALAVAVDLPLVPLLLDNYAASGLLSSAFQPDPYHPESHGFVPGEGAAAMAFEAGYDSGPSLVYHASNSDAADPVGIPKDGGNTIPLLLKALDDVGGCHAISPHATGTAVQGRADPVILNRVFPEGRRPSLHPLKPFIGHTIGASGLLESVILTRFLRDGQLPPNADHLTVPPGFSMPRMPVDAGGPVFKLSHGMGGHNSLLVISP
ncbi:beta-ketoacyl synthase N-terminal-like domain-containing protein [Luteolibacter sp. SL250]|uniref:beta-ketoacyl synthase N-terminal-like domain-containing protein n=1 Tax=Luteolibacter sp. SL250 TaxID=2995170 RepID=UPI002270E809|nr:beta-ketoacyl synthase N-terminal-like domain-containing protein [Luteolibacter sp. SL250]WAC18525.1 beta-ketoacyl synthase N-terminal-like domain-containing protein [Luteolibacter sp. SL250]